MGVTRVRTKGEAGRGGCRAGEVGGARVEAAVAPRHPQGAGAGRTPQDDDRDVRQGREATPDTRKFQVEAQKVNLWETEDDLTRLARRYRSLQAACSYKGRRFDAPMGGGRRMQPPADDSRFAKLTKVARRISAILWEEFPPE